MVLLLFLVLRYLSTLNHVATTLAADVHQVIRRKSADFALRVKFFGENFEFASWSGTMSMPVASFGLARYDHEDEADAGSPARRNGRAWDEKTRQTWEA
jgi:hypothetical protein